MSVLLAGINASPPGAECGKCTLSNFPFVPGFGPEVVDVVVIGEAPGNTEVRYGKPFVGRAGSMLDAVMEEAGYSSNKCYITNAALCRPIPHRAPHIKEIRACSGRLMQEIKDHQPKVVIPLGNAALKALSLGTSISDAHGTVTWLDELGAWVVPSYHPAAILRQPTLYIDLLHDIEKALALLNKPPVNVVSSDLTKALIETRNDVDALVERLGEVPRISLDVETTSDGRLLCVGMSWKAGTAAIVTEQALIDPYTIKALNHALGKQFIIGHNLKFDLQALWRYGITSPLTGADSMLQHYTIDERKGTHRLKQLTRIYLGASDYDKEIKNYIKEMENCPRDMMYHYNGLDASYTLALHDVLSDELTQDGKRVLSEILYPSSDVLARMEYQGVKVDMAYLQELDVKLTTEIAAMLPRMYEAAGREFNPNSPKQLIQLLYTDLNLPIPGRLSTDEEALNRIKEYHPLPELLLEYRGMEKFYKTYVLGLMKAADADHRIHCTFNLHGTVTGRLSSSSPNLQNQPRDGAAKNIFIPSDGYTLVEADLSQAEVRALAFYSKDAALIESLNSADFHTRTACIMFDVTSEQVAQQKEMRQRAKHLTFGIIYQMSVQGLARDLGISISEAEELIRRFNEAMPGTSKWIKAIQEEALTTGKVITPFGRVRHFDYITSANRGEILRQAVNTPVQSLAADLTLKALIRLDRRILRGELGDTRLLVTVHDSILLETREDLHDIARIVKEEMCRPLLGNVPIEADIKVGTRWGSLKEFKV